MSGRPKAGKARARGNIEMLRSGALRVRVYARIDPVTKKRHTLTEVVPPGPAAMDRAELIRDRLLLEVAEKRNPRTSATLDQLLPRYLDQFHSAPNTLDLYRTYVRKHISPLLGRVAVGEFNAEPLDSFYAELCRCRGHCSGRTAGCEASAPGETGCAGAAPPRTTVGLVYVRAPRRPCREHPRPAPERRQWRTAAVLGSMVVSAPDVLQQLIFVGFRTLTTDAARSRSTHGGRASPQQASARGASEGAPSDSPRRGYEVRRHLDRQRRGEHGHCRR